MPELSWTSSHMVGTLLVSKLWVGDVEIECGSYSQSIAMVYCSATSFSDGIILSKFTFVSTSARHISSTACWGW